ncbi:MAG: signal peptide peptidase SppA [Bdellovibrionota bacterium]
MTVNGAVGEEPINGGLLGVDRPSLLGLIKRLDEASKEPGIEVVLIDLKSFPLGLAAAQDLADAVLRARKAGKEVEVFLGNAGLKEYLVAAAADRIYIEEGSELRLAGLREARYYLRGTLDKIGIEGELFAKGKYKSAPETFTRKGPSEASKEASLQRLRSLQKTLFAYLSKHRKISQKKWDQVIEHALFSPEEAKDWQLVDAIDAFPDRKEQVSAIFTEDVQTMKDSIALRPRVAVIVASGDILQGRSALLSFAGSPQITYKKMETFFESALADPLTHAIVLRVSSPGGEILPSRQIASLIERAKKKKPVIVSMGDYAASGGYMISAPASEIYASPTTLTGSIGVFLGKVNLSKLYQKIDLRKEILSDAPYADLYSEDRGLTSGGRKILSRRLDQYYDNFVEYVAKQRQLALSKANEEAQGRVWTGEEAQAKKLVDKTGSYLDAVEAAAQRAGLAPGGFDYYVLANAPSLFSPFGDGGWLKAEAKTPWPVASIAEQIHWATLLAERPFLYLSPTGLMEN